MMTLSERIAEQVAKLPPEMKGLLDRELAAGNVLTDVEIGRGTEAGRMALVMDHPFRYTPERLPAGIKYREIRNRDPLLFEFYTVDQKWSLLTAKFKPITDDRSERKAVFRELCNTIGVDPGKYRCTL